METLTVNLPDTDLKAYVDQLLARGDFPSASDYITSLIREDRNRRAKARLEALLLEGLKGKPIPATEEFWEEIERQYDERHPQENGS